ncbi:MAG: phosphotransferase [Parvibaculaceae bacterium]|nr:phosphotransferase [Parvibaculaceae bacterium]
MNNRETLIKALLKKAGWSQAVRSPLAGDASTRRYERLKLGTQEAVLMDAPNQPDGPLLPEYNKPYSAIAHLAETTHPFVAVGAFLQAQGLSAPKLIAHDVDNGLLLLENLGDRLYGTAIDRNEGFGTATLEDIYRAALDALLVLHTAGTPGPLPLPDGSTYDVPAYDEEAMAIETELLPEWYIPAKSGASLSPQDRVAYSALWQDLFPKAACGTPVMVIRDYHSPNLLWLPEREGAARVGMVDYQDAQCGSRAYDVMSLLQDARKDVSPERENEMLAYYCAQAKADPSFDEVEFRTSYAILGAQRNAKIMGIFVRLWQRDGKPAYLAHLPRVSNYMERNLKHPILAPLKNWLDTHVPPDMRAVPLQAEE